MPVGLNTRRIRQRTRSMTETAGQNDRRRHASPARHGDEARHGRGWGGDDGEVRRVREVLDPRGARSAVHLGILRVDQIDPARKTGLAQVAQDGMAKRALAGARADEREGAGREQLVQAVGAHRRSPAPDQGPVEWRTAARR